MAGCAPHVYTYIIHILDNGKLVVPESVQFPDNLIVGGKAVQRSRGLDIHRGEVTVRRLHLSERTKLHISK